MSPTDPSIAATALRDLVAQRLDVRWDRFEADHPNLAAAIERVTVIDATVERLADDPAYRAAMEAAGHDEKVLAAAAKLAEVIDRWVDRALLML